MRKLVIMRGAQGVGKSTFLDEAGLSGHVLSMDAIRTLISSSVLESQGRLRINQEMNDRVFAMFRSLLNERMDRGETLAIDMTFQKAEDASRCLEFAEKHRYKIVCVDFSRFPLERAIQQDAMRPEFKRVGEFRIRETHQAILDQPENALNGIHVIPWQSDGSHLGRLTSWLAEPIHDFSNRAGILHIGDIQGCFTVLAGPGGPLEAGFRDDMVYVFVGDLLDRGIENGKVLKWFIERALPRDNVHLLWGNHEDHLHHFSTGKTDLADEFLSRTLPQLREAGITERDADRVCEKALDFLTYSYEDKKVLVTHGGLSTAPSRPELVSARQCTYGTGYWQDPVDAMFARNAPDGWYQVHGHRNYGLQPIRASVNSFNLENEIEFGGNLRTVTLDHRGWTSNSYANRVFRSRREWIEIETSSKRPRNLSKYPSWMMSAAAPTVLDDATMEAMRGHKGVKERRNESFPHVASFNFSKRVFYDGAWDDVVVKARGLFFDVDTHEIVSRGYEKFFNIGEREETSMASLKKTLKFPVTAYVKENGFLGNVGYDDRTNSLFVASKSTPDGPFADMFRTILDATLNAEQKDALRRYLRDTESSMTFEVIDPVNDPHMIEYDAPKIVLLDIIRRTPSFEKANDRVLSEVARMFGLERKTKLIQFKTWEAFEGWHRAAAGRFGYTLDGSPTEGFVIEDSSGYMTKIKTAYYSFWKRMRGTKDRMIAARTKGVAFSSSYETRPDGSAASEREITLARDFIDWCETKSSEELSSDIITLRKAFLRETMENEPTHLARACNG